MVFKNPRSFNIIPNKNIQMTFFPMNLIQTCYKIAVRYSGQLFFSVLWKIHEFIFFLSVIHLKKIKLY